MKYRGSLPLLRALLVSADAALAEQVRSVLGDQGFRVEVTSDSDAALAQAPVTDVVVLDLQVPGADSIELCRRLRAATSAYLVAIGDRDSSLSLVLSLSVGADDFLATPVETAELVARIRALLRRPRRLSNTAAIIRFADLEIDTDLREVRVAGDAVPLSSLEFEVLETLARNPKLTLSRRQLLDQVWGPTWLRDDHVIDVHISNLRRKLSDNAQVPKYIRTVRGFGFRMMAGSTTAQVA